MNTNGKKTLFVLSGGGMPGLDLHAGMWMALDEAGIFPTEISGTSAGAIVGAMMATLWSAGAAAEYLLAHQDSDFRHERPLWKLRLPWLDSIHLSDKIEISLDGCLPFSWDKVTLPFSAWAINKRTGERVNVARPELANRPAQAVLASMSICGLFPAVRLLDGEDYIDGGPRFNLPLLSNWMDYDEVWLLIAKPRPQDYLGNTIITNLIRNLNIMSLDQVTDVLAETALSPKVRVIWPDVAGDGSMLRFDHSLIELARIYTLKQLEKGNL